MRTGTIKKLCCPLDKSELKLTTITEYKGNIIEGFLTCNKCMRIYPIIYGIPVMTPDEYRDFKLEKPILDRYNKMIT